MRILALDTATPSSSVALGEDATAVALALQHDRRGHVGFLMPAIDFCFHRVGWAPSDLDLVAVDIGPGGYTGIRAGISAAQGIAAAVGVPVVTVSSLTLLALRAATSRRRIWPVVDVRRGQVATAPYRPVPGGVAPDGSPEVVSPDRFRALIESDPADTLVVGDWDALGQGTLRGLHRVRKGRPRYPMADMMLEVAVLRAKRDDFARPEEIRPLYMREPDAAINWSDFREEGMWPGATT
jgi:tRNA threonylcarbamoyladenosine biosynthesis protein TsaB